MHNSIVHKQSYASVLLEMDSTVCPTTTTTSHIGPRCGSPDCIRRIYLKVTRLLTLDLDAVRPDGIGRDPIVSLAVVYAGVVSSDVRQVQHRTLN